MGTDVNTNSNIIAMMSDIFRLILRDANPDSKNTLASGELGIDYSTGVLYFKDPNTNEIRSPNSIEDLNLVMTKYNKTSGELNADNIGGFRIYSKIHDIKNLPSVNLSIDTIISRMNTPSILITEIDGNAGLTTKMPTNNGLLEIKKMSDVCVKISFTDISSSITYNGHYDVPKHLFTTWLINDNSTDDFAITTGNNGDVICAKVASTIKDLSIITLRLHIDLNPNAEISVNDVDHEPIMRNGKKLTSTIAANSIIMLIYDAKNAYWVLVNQGENVTNVTMAMLSDRLDKYALHISTQPSKIITVPYTYISPDNDISNIIISNYDHNKDHLIVNFMQTVLRENLDYTINQNNSITLTSLRLKINDLIQFIIIKQ